MMFWFCPENPETPLNCRSPTGIGFKFSGAVVATSSVLSGGGVDVGSEPPPVAPGILIMGAPLVTGFLFGIQATAGLLAGSLVTGGVLAISASNSGGAWDNAKKYIEAGNLGGKGTDNHKAAVVGDTVGDPLKDTSGPSLNILIKLSAILSLVFVPFFVQYGGILLKFM